MQFGCRLAELGGVGAERLIECGLPGRIAVAARVDRWALLDEVADVADGIESLRQELDASDDFVPRYLAGVIGGAIAAASWTWGSDDDWIPRLEHAFDCLERDLATYFDRRV